MRTFNKRRAESCNLCKKPRLYGGKRRCTCGDPIGYLPVSQEPLAAKVDAHLEYLVRELDSIAQDPPLTPDATAEYLRGLESYVQQIRALIPREEREEAFAA